MAPKITFEKFIADTINDLSESITKQSEKLKLIGKLEYSDSMTPEQIRLEVSRNQTINEIMKYANSLIADRTLLQSLLAGWEKL